LHGISIEASWISGILDLILVDPLAPVNLEFVVLGLVFVKSWPVLLVLLFLAESHNNVATLGVPCTVSLDNLCEELHVKGVLDVVRRATAQTKKVNLCSLLPKSPALKLHA